MDRDENGRFAPGNPGGPGKPKGSRNKLSEAFLRVLADDFEQNGVRAIEQLRADSPAQYANVIAKLMPKIMDLSVDIPEDTKRVLNVFAGNGSAPPNG